MCRASGRGGDYRGLEETSGPRFFFVEEAVPMKARTVIRRLALPGQRGWMD